MFFGTDKIGFDVTTARLPVETRHFDRFSHALDEIIEARIWAGLHYRTADVQARRLGGQVADYMASTTSSRCVDPWLPGAAWCSPRVPARVAVMHRRLSSAAASSRRPATPSLR